MKTKLASALIMALTLALVLTIIPAMAYFNSVPLQARDSLPAAPVAFCPADRDLRCIQWRGDRWPLFVLDPDRPGRQECRDLWSLGRCNHGPDGTGTFTFVSEWYDPQELAAHPVKAAYDGKPQGATLVVSHGCEPAR